MRRSALFLMIVVFGFALQAQERGTKDILSLSGRYALPQEPLELDSWVFGNVESNSNLEVLGHPEYSSGYTFLLSD